MLGFIKDKAQQAKALVGEAVEASASAIVSSDRPSEYWCWRGRSKESTVRGRLSFSENHHDTST